MPLDATSTLGRAGSPLPAAPQPKTAARNGVTRPTPRHCFSWRTARGYNIYQMACNDVRRASSLPAVCLHMRRPTLMG